VEDLNSLRSHLNALKLQVRELTSAGLSLITLLTGEAERLSREDEALRLEALLSSIRRQLNRIRLNEDTASYDHSRTNLILSATNLAMGVIKAASRNTNKEDVSDYLLNSPAMEQVPFGTVLICIGPEGLPDDVRVVSVSQLAREASRHESEIISELLQHGGLLLKEEIFLLLISKLMDGIRKGRLHLPISGDKLSQVNLSRGNENPDQ